MSKDVIYSMRMSKSVREALNKLAKMEHRTVASLLDKIIMGYLENSGGGVSGGDSIEKRWYTRKIVNKAGTASPAGDTGKEKLACGIIDISTAGVLISYPKINLNESGLFSIPDFRLTVPFNGTDELLLDCEGRRMTVSKEDVKMGAVFKNSDRATLETIMKHIKEN